MRNLSLSDELNIWKTLAEQSLKGGNKVTSARLYAIRMMVETYASNLSQSMPSDEYDRVKSSLLVMSRTLEFAGMETITAKEKQIYIHMFIGCCEVESRVGHSFWLQGAEIGSVFDDRTSRDYPEPEVNETYGDGRDYDPDTVEEINRLSPNSHYIDDWIPF